MIMKKNCILIALAVSVIAVCAASAEKSRDFTDIDPNYKNKATKLNGLVWQDAMKEPFALEGAPFLTAE